MKKAYFEIELEVVMLTEDIVSTSGTYTYDGADFEEGTSVDDWEW